MKILVTGGDGFIGRHVIARAKEQGHTTESYDYRQGCDVLDVVTLDAAIARNDAVVHLAGLLGTTESFDFINTTRDVNVGGAINVFEAARKHSKRVVYIGTKVCNWYNPYLITKRCAAEFALMYAQYMGLHINVVRAMNAYGPGQHWGAVEKAIPTFIVNAILGKDLKVYGDGQQVVDLIHAQDLADIILRTLEYNRRGLSIEAGCGVPVSVLSIAKTIIRLVGSKSKVVFAPMRLGEPPHTGLSADTDILRNVLGYELKIPQEQGLADTVKWYKQHYLEVEQNG